jgi:retron-type reverse transcriptase
VERKDFVIEARYGDGDVSPILSNLFLHYTFDLWMARTHVDKLAVNLKTAKALGITLPPGILALADEVLE